MIISPINRVEIQSLLTGVQRHDSTAISANNQDKPKLQQIVQSGNSTQIKPDSLHSERLGKNNILRVFQQQQHTLDRINNSIFGKGLLATMFIEMSGLNQMESAGQFIDTVV